MKPETTVRELLASDCGWCRHAGRELEREGVETVGEYDALVTDRDDEKLIARAHVALRDLERHSAVVKWAVAALYLEAGLECLSDRFADQAAKHEANSEQ